MFYFSYVEGEDTIPLRDPDFDLFGVRAADDHGCTVLTFSRFRDTGDPADDVNFESGCFYFIYPVSGGPYTPGKDEYFIHREAAMVSESPICIRSCKTVVLLLTYKKVNYVLLITSLFLYKLFLLL